MKVTLPTLAFMSIPEPANDDVPPLRRKPNRWPLAEEFAAHRIGIDDREEARLAGASRWLAAHAEAAASPASTGSTALAAAIDGAAFAKHIVENEYGQTVQIVAGDYSAGWPVHAVDSSRDLSTLMPPEHRARSTQIIGLCRRRMGESLFTYAIAALILRKEMAEIGREEGAGASAAATGRAMVVAALRLAADIRSEVDDLEDADRVEPETLRWHFGRPANDNGRMRLVA